MEIEREGGAEGEGRRLTEDNRKEKEAIPTHNYRRGPINRQI